MGRRAARKHAFYLIFQFEFHKDFDVAEAAELLFDDALELSVKDADFVLSEVNGAFASKQELDRLISSCLVGWSLERIGKIDLALMRLAVYEMLYAPDIPVQVAINEVIELSKVFGDDESPAFLNGVLGKIASITSPA